MSNLAFSDTHGSTAGSISTDLSDVIKKRVEPCPHDYTAVEVLNFPPVHSVSIERKVPLWGVWLDGKPLTAILRKEGMYWFVEVEELNIFSEGVTQAEAVSGLNEHIEYFIEFYGNADTESLAGLARLLKQKYSKLELKV